MKKFLIVCSAGKLAGLGHLSRSLLVADMLIKNFNCEVEFIIWGDKVNFKNLKNYKCSTISSDKSLINRISNSLDDLDLIFFDLSQEFLTFDFSKEVNFLKNSSCKKIAIDCFKDLGDIFDIIFIPSYKLDYSNNLKKKNINKYVYGWDCYILNQYINVKNWSPGNNVIILSGGSDPYNIGHNLPKTLDKKLTSDVNLNWISGPFSSKPNLPSAPLTNFTEYKNPENLIKIMQKSNYAITVYGVTFFELMYLGIPTIVFSPNHTKDLNELNEIKNLDIALVADSINDIPDLLVNLMNNELLSKKLSERSRSKIKKSGLERLSIEVSLLLGQ